MRTELSIEIDCPIERVFDYTIGNVPAWSKSVVSDTVVEDKGGGDVGTTFLVVTEERGTKMDFQGEVTEFDRPRSSRVLLRGDMFDIDVLYTFKERGGGRTWVNQSSKVTANSLVFKLIFVTCGWLMKGSGKRALKSDLETLKQQLESQ